MRRSVPVLVLVTCVTQRAYAVRPFITDDARVVGRHAAQLETWVRVDRHGLQHWIAPAFGPVKPLELSIAGVYGSQEGKLGAAFPVLQAKALARETKEGQGWPGIAVVGGTVGTGGGGSLRNNQWDTFGYVALSESFLKQDHFLVHQNLGLFVSTLDAQRRATLTWGVGTQIYAFHDIYFVGELFSGDPYSGSASGAAQVGFRWFASPMVQVDGTIGKGMWGTETLPVWCSFGLRIASDPGLW